MMRDTLGVGDLVQYRLCWNWGFLEEDNGRTFGIIRKVEVVILNGPQYFPEVTTVEWENGEVVRYWTPRIYLQRLRLLS